MSDGDKTEESNQAHSNEAEESMHIHRPKPLHGAREVLGEIAIIVVGIIIALIGEQAVEAFNWRHKIAEAEVTMKKELVFDLNFAAEQKAMRPCALRYIGILQQAVAKNRPDVVMALYRMGQPLNTHPWKADSWAAALNGQVSDHLSPQRANEYSLAFHYVTVARDQQWQLVDLYAEAMSGRIGRLDDPAVAYDELKVADRLKANEGRAGDIGDAMLRTSFSNLGLGPSADRAVAFRQRWHACEVSLNSISLP